MSKTLDFDPDTLRQKYRHERDRRLRAEANDQYVEITADFRHYDDPRRLPGFTAVSHDAVDVVIVGGGFGGLAAARLREAGARISASSRRAATSEAPGTGIAIRRLRSEAHLPAAAETGYIPKKSTASATRSRHARRIGSTSTSTDWPVSDRDQ
jgi:cyclohexanone monooxygenase